MPKVSIIMPAHNREKFIAESIRSAQAQTFKDFELIIIDDGSKDGTVEAAEKAAVGDSRIRIERNPSNLGIAKTRNRALELARAEYIAPLDSDDIWLDREKLTKQVAFLDSHPDYSIVGGDIIHIDVDGKQLKKVSFPTTDSELRKTMLRYNPFAQSTLMYRKSAIMACGAYDSSFKVCDDYALWLCVGTKKKFENIPSFFAGYRVHIGNITRTKRLTAAKEILDIVRSHSCEYPHAAFGVAKAYVRLLIAYMRT